MLANAMGAIVIGVDPVAYRRDLACRHGAAYVLDPSSCSIPEEAHAVSGTGVEVAIETSGSDQARIDVIDAAAYQARIVYVGIGGKEKNVMLGPMLGERWLTGSNIFTAADFYDLVQLMLRSGIRFSDLVTHRFALENAQEAFDTFAGSETGKVMFVIK